MSIVPKETIEVIAQSVGIPSLGADVAVALAPDVEYRLREIMQESIKCMRHAKRTVLTADDVDSALGLRNVEPVYGFASGDPLRFKRAVGHKDLFYLDDREVDFKEIIEAPLPKAPLDTSVVAHWLAIEGIQPAIPENPAIDAIVAPTETKRSEHGKDDGLPVDVKLPVKHVLSRELQLHQLMPSMITCIVAKRLGHRLSDNHWELRDFSANLVASVCRRFGHVYHNLQNRLTKTLIHAFLDPAKSLTQHYGAVQGISALGPSAIRLLLLPNLVTYMQLLEPELQLERQKNEMKRKEAWRVYGALLCAAGKCLYDRLKLFPGLLSPSMRPLLRSNKRVLTNNPNKRKSSTDLSATHPPLKKMATDAAANSMSSVSIGGNMQGAMDSFSNQLANPGMIRASSSGQMVESIPSVAIRRDQGSDLAQRVSAVLRQAWKEDQDTSHLLGSLYEVFGEAIFSFAQPPEISLFV